MTARFMVRLAICAVGLSVSGCVSAPKNILVSVVDAATGAPVPGATVRTSYVSLSKFSLASKRTSESVTDQVGRALLVGNYLLPEPAIGRAFPDQGFQPGFEVLIDNPRYRVHMGQMRTDYYPGPFVRPRDYVPTEPDVTFRISSRETEAARRARYEEQKKSDEQKAAELLARAPTFWPQAKDDVYRWPKEAAEGRLIELRWEHASKTTFGVVEDIPTIDRLVIDDMQQPRSSVGEKRWLSQTVVMVYASWYSGPLAAAGYYYVLEKKNGRWAIIAHYMIWIS